MALEGLAAEKAAPLITSDEIVVVESHYHALAAGASAGNPADYMRANWLFHTGHLPGEPFALAGVADRADLDADWALRAAHVARPPRAD